VGSAKVLASHPMIKGVTSGGSAAVVRTLDHSTLEVH